MVNFPPPDPPAGGEHGPVYKQYAMVNARRQFAIPSIHQLVSDAYVTLGSELERLRCLEKDDSDELDDKAKIAIYKQSILKAEALSKLVRTLQALRQEERAAASNVDGRAIEDMSDAEILDLLARNGRTPPDGVYAAHRETVRQGAAPWNKPEPVQPLPYKRERGPRENSPKGHE